MITAGIDAGSRAIKIVLWDSLAKKVIAESICDQGVNQKKLATDMFDRLLAENNILYQDIHRTVATGYGRHMLEFCDTAITEISCHTAGVSHHIPSATTIIDIGGQDSKLIRVDNHAKVRDFVMNDRCAAGTGRFLEIVSERLKVPLEQLGSFAKKSVEPAHISSMCVVFAETEIIGLLAKGQSVEDIIAGVQSSIAKRVLAMAGGSIESPIVFTGGVALVSGMKEVFDKLLKQTIELCPNPQFTGALGAAILASKQN